MIKVKNLSKYYNNQLVLIIISIDIKKGEFISIVVPSGAGKTTFLNIICTFDSYDKNKNTSLLFNKICSVLDAKSFYLSRQQHLNQLEAAVEDMTYMIYLHVISVMTWVMLTLTDYWTWYRTIMGVNLMSLGIRLLFIINCSVLDVKLFYLSLQQATSG